MSEDFFKAIRSYLTVYLPKQKCYSPNTIKSYRNALGLFIEYLRTEKGIPLSDISFALFGRELFCDFLDWLQTSRRCGAATRNQRLAVLRAFFKYAGLIDCVHVALQMEIEKVPKQKSAPRIVEFLPEQALLTLLNEPDIQRSTGLRNRFFMILMYDTAARCQELLDLQLKDFEIGSKNPYVYLTGKRGKTRAVPLMKKTLQHYHQYLRSFHSKTTGEANDYLFYTTIHNIRGQMSPDTVAAFMKVYGMSARKKCPDMPAQIHPHQLRHTRAIHIYRGGMPLPLLSELLGL